MTALVVVALAVVYVIGYLRGVDRGRGEEAAMQVYRRHGDPDLGGGR